MKIATCALFSLFASIAAAASDILDGEAGSMATVEPPAEGAETSPSSLRNSNRELTAPIATFYQDFHFNGRKLQVTLPGKYDISFLNHYHFNNVISSMKIATGYAVKLCTDAHFRHCKEYGDAGAHPQFGISNDKVSSFIVYQPAAILYENFHYGGRAAVADSVGHFNTAFLDASAHLNNRTSSMFIQSGFQVLLCYDEHFRHCKHEPDSGNHPVFGSSNDKVSSFEVSRRY